MMPNQNDGTFYLNNITNNIIYDTKDENQKLAQEKAKSG